MAKKKSSVFECQHCGAIENKWLGKCSQCNAWDSFIELKQEQIELIQASAKLSTSPSKALELAEIEIEDFERVSSQDEELDLVLGGGIVKASLVLIGGSPGIGKSTLLLKIASNLANEDSKVLYVSGEESANQIKLRANRLEANAKNLFLLTEINLENVLEEINKKDFKFLIIDSIQTLYNPNITSAPGSVSQVREVTFELMRIAKTKGISTFIIGHITKEGSIAGPRILEHMVDVVLYFEGDASKELRLLRSFKNRFGSSSEIGIFEMTQQGLVSAKNIASKFFTRGEAVSGSAITITMQGSRAISIEVQALVCESSFPKRSSNGFDRNRLDMLLALLERKIGISLSRYDVFINISGGVKIAETACDLAVIAAIVSSFKNREISKDTVFIGEVTLNGEVREIFNLDLRLKEASMQKFKNAIVPNKAKENYKLKSFVIKEINQLLEWM